ncbi:OLC1v1022919C1 [Oldenlandia corymbosa var. corymbosa]|uniref:OLC1v1022919C1 n=1 Tax=Oldenlandia corymbosa var. corymbosa TaxID=529605 RepID=A0AAV1BZL4_OLDCO|nr:OLC1v1022919C1 [Oldenlandia corymbosa var. corymbosa]
MELFISFSCFIIFLIIVTKLVRKTKPNLPPGPKALPLIGNLHQLNGPLPHRILADLAKQYGPLMHLRLGEVSTMIVSSAEYAKLVMNDHDVIFANRPYFLFSYVLNYKCQDIAFAPHNNSWRILRKICNTELLSAKRVQSFRPIREDETMSMIKTIASQKGSVINLTRMIYSLTYSIIARSAFGKRSKYHDQYMVLMERIIKLMGGFSIVDLYPSVKILERITGLKGKLEDIQKQVDEVLESIMEEHRVKHADPSRRNHEESEDLVDVMLNIQRSGEYGDQLTNDNIKGAIYDVFSAGGETSSKTVVWAMFEMMKKPEVLRKAQEEVRRVCGPQGNVDESHLRELKYVQAVIKETMRFRPSAPLLLPRESTERIVLNGYEIPAKSRVIINAFALGRDPNHWTDPDTFNPDRFLDSDIDYKGKNFAYIPFGAGRRICPGISFALPNMELPIAQLLYHFDWELPGKMRPEDLDMSEIFGLTVGPRNDLNLVPTGTFQLSTLAAE